MPKWIHDRAKSLQREMEETYPPKKAKQVAFAVATQQAHAAGKAPKTWRGKPFGTSQGKREAKRKFDRPRSSYDKTAASQNPSSCATLETMQSGSNALARLFQPESGPEKMSKQASRRELAQKEKLSMVRSPREAKMIEARSVMEEILGVPNTAKRAQLEGLMGDMNAAPVAAMDPRLVAAAFGAPGAAMPGITGAPAMGPAPIMAGGAPGQRVDTGPGFAGYGGDPTTVAHVGPGAMPMPAAGPTPGDFQAMAMSPAAQPAAMAKAPVKTPGPQNAAKTGSLSQKLALSLDDLKDLASDPRVIGGAGGAAVGGIGSALATKGMKDKKRRAAIIAGSTVAGGGAGAGIGHLLRGGSSGKGEVPAGIRRHFNPMKLKAMAYKNAAATPSAAGPSGMSVPMTPGASPTAAPQVPMASRGSVTPAPTTPTAGVQDFQSLLAEVQERAFQETRAKYAQAASSGPLRPYANKLDEYRDRSVGIIPAAAGLVGGHMGGRFALRQFESMAAQSAENARSQAFAEGQKLINDAKAKYPKPMPGKGKLPSPTVAAQTTARNAAIRAAQEEAAKIVSEGAGKGVPWYAKAVKGSAPKLRGSIRAIAAIGAPLAGLATIKGLLGRGRSPAERMYETPKYGQLGEFAASHPMATALGAAALGGLAPWAAKGISNQLGYEFDPSAVSGLGAAAGGLAGYYAAKRGQNKRIQEAMKKEREQQEQENLYRELMAQQQSPFGY